MRFLPAFIISCAVVLAVGHAVAQASNSVTHELEGFTSGTFSGAQGVLGFTLACQTDFGATARMCDSMEVIQTTHVPIGPSGDAWVRPRFQGYQREGTRAYLTNPKRREKSLGSVAPWLRI